MKKIPFTTIAIWGLLIAVAALCFPSGHAMAADAPAYGLPMFFGFAGLIDIFDTRTMLEKAPPFSARPVLPAGGPGRHRNRRHRHHQGEEAAGPLRIPSFGRQAG